MTHLLIVLCCAFVTASCGDDPPSTTTPTPTSPLTSTFASRITVGGSATRTFTTTQAGNITVRLNSSSSQPIGLGLGLPFGGISTCTLSTSVEASPASVPHISTPVDNGTYCVSVYDLGNLTGPVDFEVIIIYP